MMDNSDGMTVVGPISMSGSVDPLEANHRMRAITPVTLPADVYTIVAVGYSATELNGNTTASLGYPPTIPNTGGGLITFNSASYGGVGFGLPTTSYPDANVFHAGTFKFATTSAGVQNTNTGIYYCTIQAAIDDPLTDNGHTITVATGTYVENIIVNKSLTILGPNAAINPCIGSGVAAAILMPSLSQPFYDGFTEVRMMQIEADNVIVKGFTFDGNNPLLTTNVIDAADGIDIYLDKDGIVIQNNIFKNSRLNYV